MIYEVLSLKSKLNKENIHKNINRNETFINQKLGLDVSFDVGFRKQIIRDKEIQLYYVTGLTDTAYIIEIIKALNLINEEDNQERDLYDLVYNQLVHQQVEVIHTMDEVVDQLLSGLVILFVDGSDTAFCIDVRQYPGRAPQEPDTEKVIRGSRDGYTENIIENTALTRRRIRDERLRNELIQVGERSKTDICISYLEDIADPVLIEKVKKELDEISIDGLSMADKTIEEYIVKQGMNPYPLVRYTERPDVAAAHLFEGHVLIMVDTSPSMIILPTTFFHHVQHAEEYREAPSVGTFVRWIRFLGIIASIFLLPFWLVLVQEPELLPSNLKFIGPNEVGNIPIIVQILLADIGIEFLRMAAIHTPTPLSTAMGLIAAILIGEIAIEVGLFSSEVILYVAVSAIGTFATPSYELSVANKMIRILLILVTFFFGLEGFLIGSTLFIILISGLKSLDTPYLWPWIPFNANALTQILLRISVPLSKTRPSIVKPKNNRRQSE